MKVKVSPIRNLFNFEDGSCQCGGHAIKVVSKSGKEYERCTNYPKCMSMAPVGWELSPFMGHDLMTGDEFQWAWADAMYDGDGK